VGLLLFAGSVGVLRVPAEEEKGTGQERRTYGMGELRKLVSVVKTETAPAIDGIMDEGEWNDAAAVTGLTATAPEDYKFGLRKMENVARDQSTFWITYDDQYLYIAHHSPPPARIRQDPAQIAAMLGKDSVRLALADPYPSGDDYWIFVDPGGASAFTHGSRTHMGSPRTPVPGSHLKGLNHDWNPRVVHGSTQTLEGWVFEVAIPWEDFGPHIARPQPGGILRMNFIRHWRKIIAEDHFWKMFDWETADPGRMLPAGELLFQGDEGIVVRLEDTGNLPGGQAAFAATLTNRSATERDVIAEVSTDSGELQDRREITLGPDESAPYAFVGRIADFATTKIAFTVRDAASGEAIHVTTLPVIRRTEPEINIRRYRSFELIKFETDFAFLGATDPGKTSVQLTLTDKKTGRTMFRKTLRGFTSYELVFELSTEGWTPGEYEARFVFQAPGTKQYETIVPYEHAPLPEWWNNRYGFEDMDHDRVPYPWTNMTVENQTVRVWGRQYRFNDKLLPEQITTLDKPLLRAPMRLLIKTAEGKVVDTSAVEATSKWTKTSQTRVEGTRVLDAEGFSLRNRFWAEYDGLVWSALRIEPKGKISIASMELEIPLTRAFTDVINTYDYSLRQTGRLPPAGFSGSTRPIWLGNGEGGIQWFCETDGWFFVRDTGNVLRVDVGEEGATLRVVMIDVPTEFDAPHEIQFGWIATPVRPKTWRTPEHTAYRSPLSDNGGGGCWYRPGYDFLPAPDLGHPYGTSAQCLYVYAGSANTRTDAAGTDDFRHFGDEWLANGAERIPFESNVRVTGASPTFRDWFVWRYRRFQRKYGYGGLYYDGSAEVVPANPYAHPGYRKRDGTTANLSPLLGTREIFKRLYNITLSNPDIAPRDAWIGLHNSGRPNMAYLGFGTQNWNAENFNAILNDKQPTYLGVVDPALFRAELMGHNFGWPVRFLGQSRVRREWVEAHGGPEAVYDQLTGLALLHDTVIPFHMPSGVLPGVMGSAGRRMAEAIEKHRYFHWAFQFTPYWRQEIVALPDENMHASFYVARPSKLAVVPDPWKAPAQKLDAYFDKHLPKDIKVANRLAFVRTAGRMTMDALPPHKAILILYNNTDWEGQMRLQPDWQKLGFDSPEGLQVENAVHRTGMRIEMAKNEKGEEVEQAVFFERPEEYAKLENGELLFPMTKWNYRMIVIEREQ